MTVLHHQDVFFLSVVGFQYVEHFLFSNNTLMQKTVCLLCCAGEKQDDYADSFFFFFLTQVQTDGKTGRMLL